MEIGRSQRAARPWLALATMLVLTLLLPLQSVQAKTPAPPDLGHQVRQIPLRWCTLSRSPDATPGDRLALRRQQAASKIWLDKANVAFRSAITREVSTRAAHFPVIRDADGDHGDVLDPNFGDSELSDVLRRCGAAWERLADDLGITDHFRGPIAVDIRFFVSSNGQPTENWGYGGWTSVKGTDHYCTDPTDFDGADGGYVMVGDPSLAGDKEHDTRLVAHELGHVLLLGHGDGLDDIAGRGFDDWCDTRETSTIPETLMDHNTFNGRNVLKPLQRDLSRRVARVYRGVQVLGPDDQAEALPPDATPAPFTNGDTLGDERLDDIGDVGAPSVDMRSVSFTVDSATNMLTVSHTLTGSATDGTNTYIGLVDLDGERGGSPDQVGIPYVAQGIDLITQATVDASGLAAVTVWTWQDAAGFVDISAAVDDQGLPAILAEVTTGADEALPNPTGNVVDVGIPTNLVGAIIIPPAQTGDVILPTDLPPVTLAAIALQGTVGAASGEIDILPGGAGDPNGPFGGGGAPLSLAAPAFPSCTVTPLQVPLGVESRVVVEASRFNGRPDDNRFGQPVLVYVGDNEASVAGGQLGDNGAVTIPDVPIAADTPEGLTPLSVVLQAPDETGALDDSALTADCVLQVGQEVPPDPE